MEIEIIRILIDESVSPRNKVNSKHVDEFVELEGEWPAVLVRPIIHDWYTHQLIDGFHRISAADRLNRTTIDARSEEMDDAIALARALRENLHGMPMTAEERKERVVMLRKTHQWTQDQIAKETGVTFQQVSKYCRAARLDEELFNSIEKSPNLTIDQAAALGKILSPDPDSQQGKRTDIEQPPQLIQIPRQAKPDPKAQQREAARPHIPEIAKVAAEHKLTPPVISAIADAVLAAPNHVPEILEKVITDRPAPDAIRFAGKVLADTNTPQALKEDILKPGTAIRDQQGTMPGSEPQRIVAASAARQPETIAQPLASYLVALNGYQKINEDVLTAWFQTADHAEIELCENVISAVEQFFTTVRDRIKHQRRDALRLISS